MTRHDHLIFWPILSLILFLVIGSFYLLPPLVNKDSLPKPGYYLGDQVKDYMSSQRSTLAPPVVAIRGVEIEDALGHREFISFRNDHKSPDPLIIKINRLEYLIYSKGMFVVKKAEDGGEQLIDLFFGIHQPPPPPSGDDDSWKPDKPDRWDYRP